MKTPALKMALLAMGCAAAALAAVPALAKLPAPSEEAKAKAAEVAAKAAHGGKVAAYQLCKAQDRTAAAYFAQAKKDGKATKPAEKTADCVDPSAQVATAAPAAPAKKK